jgi:hypothetical protein
VLGALSGVGYERLVCVELSRDSHRADRMVGQALATLRAAEAQTTPAAPTTSIAEVPCASVS